MNWQTVPDYRNPSSPDYIELDDWDIFDLADEKYEEIKDKDNEPKTQNL